MSSIFQRYHTPPVKCWEELPMQNGYLVLVPLLSIVHYQILSILRPVVQYEELSAPSHILIC